MVSSLLLLLKGPMQSWGDQSRYKTRGTGSTPTKSGIIGLLAAAEGRRRTDPIEDLARMELAVRVDQAGTLMRDYQTAHPWQKDPTADANLITRHYLTDAAFLVAVEHDDREVLEGLVESLRNPAFPLFLGRRSCPAPVNLVQGIVDKPCTEALMDTDEWFATTAHKRERDTTVYLPIYRDGRSGEPGEKRQDVPLSFSSEHRKYGWRTVVYAGAKEVENKEGTRTDPFFEAVISV